ncbi:MAG: IS4 family transposase [Candidatus Falkowbacteria bacterium]|nr:IS4 family transposase [Candidatus Falkowbacteria bacterium]
MRCFVNTIFGQLLQFLPRNKFNQYVGQHETDKLVRKMTTWNQFNIMLFAQAKGMDSLRDIETSFNLHKEAWYHLGIKTVAKSTLADANQNRSYEVYEKLFYALFESCKEILPERVFDFKNPLYSFDSTIIKLCLSVFNWAKYTRFKGALKIHTLLNNRSTIPEFMTITDGKVGDLNGIKLMDLEKLEKNSIIVFDRAYIDYSWWYRLNQKGIFFVSRVKSNQNIFVTGQHEAGLEKNILADEIVIFGDYDTIKKAKYPEKLRRVKFYNEEKKKIYTYLTNNFTLTATQIAQIYKERWQIELFFKRVKQNLKIKTFLGTSKNAVLTQIWIAMIYYLLLAYIKFQTKFKKSLLDLTRIVRETLMIRRNFIDLLSLTPETIHKIKDIESQQLSFW